jgi:serine/threonine protein phosphatase PrpC
MHEIEHHDDGVKTIHSSYFVKSETNQRENNEDSFLIYRLPLIHDIITILAIADGMGGHAFGEQVSREALRKMSLALFEQLCIDPVINQQPVSQALDADSIGQALWNAFEQANVFIKRMVQINKWGKAGSTIVVAAISGNIAVVANLGDSALFHYEKSNGHLKKITDDHTVTGVLLRAGMITPEMALYHEGRNRLEFFVGAENLPRKVPLYSPFTLAPADLLLLCTDGVSAVLLHEQMEKIIAETDNDPETVAHRLFEAARQAGETDNQTIVIWQQGGILNEQVDERFSKDATTPPEVQNDLSVLTDQDGQDKQEGK